MRSLAPKLQGDKMILRAYRPDATPDKVVRIDVKQSADGIVINAVDENGDIVAGGHLVKLRTTGRIWHCRNVDPDLGFDLDGNGRIKLDE